MAEGVIPNSKPASSHMLSAAIRSFTSFQLKYSSRSLTNPTTGKFLMAQRVSQLRGHRRDFGCGHGVGRAGGKSSMVMAILRSGLSAAARRSLWSREQPERKEEVRNKKNSFIERIFRVPWSAALQLRLRSKRQKRYYTRTNSFGGFDGVGFIDRNCSIDAFAFFYVN